MGAARGVFEFGTIADPYYKGCAGSGKDRAEAGGSWAIGLKDRTQTVLFRNANI